MRWPVGGIRTYILYNYPTLAARGYRFTFVGPADTWFRRFAEDLRDWEGVEFVEAPLQRKRCRLRSTVRSLLRSGRFALMHSHGMIAAAEAALANLRIGIPHVVTSHDVFRPEQVAGLTGRMKLWILGRLLQQTDAIVNVSHDAQENLLAYIPKLRKKPWQVLTIRNGIDMTRLSDLSELSTTSLRQHLGISTNVTLFGFLGRFMEQKGFLPLLEALEQLVAGNERIPCHLVAVGSGDHEREYYREVERRGLTSHVTVMPYMPDIRPVLQQLDVLVVPSLWEACPLLPMEALALGVPVLGSDCIGLREVLRGTPSMVAPAGNAEAWCRALREAMTTPWTEAARAYAVEARRRFDVTRSARQLGSVFDQLLFGQFRPSVRVGQLATVAT
jgi:glycosyltransferase involved in cell wall biosynthesis